MGNIFSYVFRSLSQTFLIAELRNRNNVMTKVIKTYFGSMIIGMAWVIKRILHDKRRFPTNIDPRARRGGVRIGCKIVGRCKTVVLLTSKRYIVTTHVDDYNIFVCFVNVEKLLLLLNSLG